MLLPFIFLIFSVNIVNIIMLTAVLNRCINSQNCLGFSKPVSTHNSALKANKRMNLIFSNGSIQEIQENIPCKGGGPLLCFRS